MPRNIYIKRVSNLMLALLLFVTSFSLPLVANENINNTVDDTSMVEQEEENTEIDVIGEETIQVEEDESTSGIADSNDEPKQRVTPAPFDISNSTGNLSFTIEGYNPSNGWKPLVNYDAEIFVDFGTISTETGKTVEINIPDGIRYVTYPVNGVPTNDVEQVATGALLNFIDAVDTPEKNQLYQTYTGKLIYHLLPGTEKVKIPLKLAVDEVLYYGPKSFLKINGEDLTAKAYSDLDKEIGSASLEVNAVNIVSSMYNWVGLSDQNQTLLNDGTTKSIFAGLGLRRSGGLYELASRFYTQQVDYYYPIIGEVVIENPNSEFYVDTDNNVLHYQHKNRTSNDTGTMRPIMSVVPGTPEGTYSFPNSKIVLTTYDGTELTFERKGATIKVIDTTTINNKLLIDATNNINFSAIDDNFERISQFRIYNDQLTTKTNQVLEYTIEPEYQVTQMSFKKAASNIEEIEYQTNKNSDIQIASGSQILTKFTNNKVITKSSVGLAEDEFFVFARVRLGVVTADYTSTPRGNILGMSNNGPNGSHVIGRLKDGVNTASMTITTYEADGIDNAVSGTMSQATQNIIRNDKETVYLRSNITNYNITAGTTQNIKLVVKDGEVHSYDWSLGTKDVKFYLRKIPNSTINPATIKLMQGGQEIPLVTNIIHSDISGEQFIEVVSINKLGRFFDGVALPQLELSFDLQTTLAAEGNYSTADYLFYKVDGVNVRTGLLGNDAISDLLDVNNNGNTSEKIVQAQKKQISINAVKGIYIDTTFKPTGQTVAKPSYDPADVTTATGFTPGTTGDYQVDIVNNTQDSSEIVSELTAYLPIPKRDQDFGNQFQETSANWNMKLNSVPHVKIYDADGVDVTTSKSANYKITYATNATSINFDDPMIYSSIFTNASNMIRVENISGIAAGERAELHLDYVVDETTLSAQTDGKIGTINDFMPYYHFTSSTAAGYQNGTRVGAILQNGEFKGFIFKDLDYDGIYNNNDVLIVGKTVKLLLKDTTGAYQETDMIAITDNNGEYLFEGLANGDYQLDFNAVLDTKQKFTLHKKGVNNDMDSDVVNAGAKVGLVSGLDPTDSVANKVTVGVIDYEAPTVSVMPTTHTMKASNAQKAQTKQLTTTITPTYFNKIKAMNDAIVWSSDTTAVATVDSNGIITAVSQGTATISVTITDLYGNTDTASMVVTVESNDIPVITGNDAVTVKLGDSFVSRDDSGLSIHDTEDGTILLTDTTKVVVTGTVPVDATNQTTTLGTYTVKYVVTDTDGNTASKTLLVNVTADGMPPVVDTTVQVAANDFSLDFTHDADGNIEALGNTVTITSVQAAANALGTNIVTAANGDITVSPLATTVEETELATLQTTTEPGVYPLTFTTTNGANTASKTIAVTLSDINKPTANGDATLYATNFTIAKADLPLTSNDVVGYAGATAFETIKDTEGNVTAINPLTVTTKVSDLAALNATQEDVVLVELSATSTAGFTVTKKIAVTVTNGGQPSTSETLTLFGHNFTIEDTDAPSLTALQALTKATATAYETTYDADHVVTNVINRSSAITVDETQLATIQAAEFGMYPLDLSVTSTDGTQTTSKTIIVTVKTKDDPSENGDVSLFASDFNVKLGEHTTLTDTQVQTAAQVKAFELVYTASMIQIHPLTATTDTTELAAIQTATVTGTYPLTFTTTNGTDTVTRTIVVTITNDGQPPIVNGQVQIAASDFSVKLDDVATVEGITESGAVGTEVIKDTPGSVTAINPLTVTVDPTELTAIQTTTQVGAYPLTFTTTNGTDTVSKTIVVTITNDGEVPVISGNVQISASDFSVEILDAATVNGIAEAGAFANQIVKVNGTVIGINPLTVVVDTNELSAITATIDPGVFPLTFTATDGVDTVSITIQVTVVVPGPYAETIVANNFTTTLDEVATADFITLAGALAQDVTNPLHPVNILVTEVSNRPTTSGFHTVRFETTTGGFIEVEVLVTNEAAINNEVVVAHDFTIDLKDLDTADFIVLAEAQGYDITNVTAPVEIPVTEVSVRPTRAGKHTIRFETANGGYAEVAVWVTTDGTEWELNANNIILSLDEVDALISNNDLNNQILIQSDAKAVNGITGQEVTNNITVTGLEQYVLAPTTGIYNIVLSTDVPVIQESQTRSITTIEESTLTITKEITLQVEGNALNELPSTGETIRELLVYSLIVLIAGSIVFILYVYHRLRIKQ